MPKPWDSAMHNAADPEQARSLQRFFKTGPGQYGEGDRFLGITVPIIRTLVKKYRRDIDLDGVSELLRSPYHEKRLFALLLLVAEFRADKTLRPMLFELYLANTAHINSWDLVDASAPHIVGAFLQGKNRSPIYTLARSSTLWERRIAMLSTLHFIRQGEAETALDIAAILVHDTHDLIHKAVGWMLREVGRHCGLPTEEAFLRRYCTTMPRTMLRSAIERFPAARRRAWLTGSL